jgi:FAD binding domain-containing protein/D-arabinono-1,4-lactone oxidase
MSAPRYEVRRTWHNHARNVSADPLRLYDARSLEDLVAIVGEAEARDVTVRAVGSSHSWSDIVRTEGFLVRTHGYSDVIELETGVLRPGLDLDHLVHVQAGMRIRKLNRELAERKLALANMGGYDAQTVAGVMSTATHGSGVTFGPIADFARSIDLVAGGGRVIRVEPSEGITDPDAFAVAHPDWQLEQDDDWFDAVRVGAGCMGLMYSVHLDVVDAHWLKEERVTRWWSDVREDLLSGVLERHLHYELLFSPYPRRDGEIRFLQTTREPTEPSRAWFGDPRRRRNSIPEFLALVPGMGRAISAIVSCWPSLTPGGLDRAITALADKEFSSASFRVMNIGTANLLPAYSSEIGVAVDERNLHIAAIEKVIEIVARRREIGSVYQSAPIALRFVKASTAHLAMMHGARTMMLELIQNQHSDGWLELLAEYEEALYDLGGRPHWGQVNTLTGSHGLVRSMYPRFDDWVSIHRQINDTGVFDSPFAKQMGISTFHFGPKD